MAVSELEESFATQIKWLGLPVPVREYRFAPPRRWRMDFAWPDLRYAVEIEGGTRRGGRHTTHEGFSRDCEKYNLAVLKGWAVMRFTSTMVNDGSAIAIVEEYFNAKGIQGDGGRG